ncbi:hypothetical protein LSH36_340g00042 [Paralvinella palmiformis]|uniref:C2H2-type domain-containing protein n=1 Tax=Paralvinella palmiformis TaxID=53620 RepID=A0AAD9JG72_9ANNE|nr:hypothetical protein LSH36_340g00042 [Paralvinella palmiformis]
MVKKTNVLHLNRNSLASVHSYVVIAKLKKQKNYQGLHVRVEYKAVYTIFCTIFCGSPCLDMNVAKMTPTTEQQTAQSQTEHVHSQNQNCQTEMASGEQQETHSQTENINSHSQKSQTEIVSVNQHVAQSQTEIIAAQSQLSQTERVQHQDTLMQTNIVDIQHSAMQTTPKTEHQQSQQTDIKTMANTNSQTDTKILADTVSQTEFRVRLVPDSADQNTQAGSWNPRDSISQTDQSMSLMTEGTSQTQIHLSVVCCQTDPTVTGECETQTVINTAETSAQAVVEDHEAACQAVVEDSSTDMQTDISYFSRADGVAQAVVDVVYQECQATVDCHVQEIQTNSSMALLVDQDAQATAECVEQVMQTDIAELIEQDVQTELEVEQKFSQTEIAVADNECQTAVVVSEIETQTEVEVVETAEVSVPEVAGSDVAVESENQATSGSGLVVSAGGEPKEYSEEACQTDPVTIIIGDASFLVKKLKSSALSPTKVSSMGNEIEIELRADEDETYELPERENIRPVQYPAANPRASPGSYRARGVRTRGGMRGSPRVGHAQVIRQQPNPKPPQPSGGQYYATSAGGCGKYSCPVCSDTFHESPALYEHLQLVHAEAFNLIKKPRGREGKTIIMRPSPERDPPVLTPVEPVVQQAQQQQQQQVVQQQVEVMATTNVVQQPVQQVSEVGLFEEPGPVWTTNKARKRSLARRQITDEDTAVIDHGPGEGYHIVIQPSGATTEDEEQGLLLGKRKRDDEDGEVSVKRGHRVDGTEEDSVTDEGSTDASEETPKRRSVRSTKERTETSDDTQSPRTRGRLRTPKK